MIHSRRQVPILSILAGFLATGSLCVGMTARSQDSGSASYATGEEQRQQTTTSSSEASEGPVRLARFSYIQGNVTWRPDDTAEWSTSTVNLPLRQGAQVWVTGGGRAEIQFDDGSYLRLGNNAVATLQTLYSDGEGEFTEIKLTDGLASLRLKHDHSVFQVDTPLISVKATGPAGLRVGAGDGVEVGVRLGAATVEGLQGKVDLHSGEYLTLANENAPYDVRSLPRADTWEQWNDDRDAHLEEGDRDNREHNLPPNIALVASDLDAYGSWRQEPNYGWVWCPRVTTAEWRPYYLGHWTWVNPFGWTWVSDEPWGWAPYHYGSWAHLAFGWAWVPGPVHQCWSPAVVHFTECDDRVAWCPLAPHEVHYGPVLAIGYRHGDWSALFSIGRAAVYYPTVGGYCEPRFFNTRIVNHVTYVSHVTNVYNGPTALNRYGNSSEYFAANNNTYLNARFIPANARFASGVTAANVSAFGGRGAYQPVSSTGAALFQRGRVIAAPPLGRAPSAGPTAVRPTAQALTPTRTFVIGSLPPRTAITRPVYRAPLQPSVERASNLPIRTLPVNPTRTRIPDERTAVIPGRGNAVGGGQATNDNPLTRRGSSSQITGSSGSNHANDRGTGRTLTPEEIRAREARRALGMGGGTDTTGNRRTDGSARQTGGTYNGNGRPLGDGGARRDSTYGAPGNGRSYGDEGRRRDPNTGSPRSYPVSPQTPPAEPRRTDPSYGRSRPTDPSTSTESRRVPAPTIPEARRVPPPQQNRPPSAPEPRRDPPPHPAENPRRESSSGSGGSRSSEQPKGSSESKDKDKDKDKDRGSSGSSSPATGRGRR